MVPGWAALWRGRREKVLVDRPTAREPPRKGAATEDAQVYPVVVDVNEHRQQGQERSLTLNRYSHARSGLL